MTCENLSDSHINYVARKMKERIKMIENKLSTITILQKREASIIKGLEYSIADIESFKMMHCPEEDIQELENAWAALYRQYQQISNLIGLLNKS